MEDALTCDICTERFTAGDHEPLVLLCGHSFCRSCLNNMIVGRVFSCPNCRRKQNDIDVNSLPVNFKLLALASESVEPKSESCLLHGDELTYWCQTCQVSLCGFCIYADHPREHEVVRGKDFLLAKRRNLVFQFQKWKNGFETKNNNKINTILGELRDFHISEASFAEVKKDISRLLAANASDLTAESLQDLESKMSSLMKQFEESECKTELTESTASTESTESSELSVTEGMPDEQPEQASVAQASGASVADESSQPEESLYYIENCDGQKAVLQWQDGKLLMSAFWKNPIQRTPVFKVPKEVFLKISVKNECLGLIIVQPWYHLRRAYQFAFLCMGTFGISYLGSNFFRVHNKNQPQEVLSGGWYLTNDGSSCKDLLTDLEWGGPAIGDATAGLVVAFSTLREPKHDIVNDASGFGICTRGERGGIFKCPFGIVTSGLDIAKRIVQLDNIPDAVITQCGAVVFDRDD